MNIIPKSVASHFSKSMNTSPLTSQSLNARERKAQRLLAHYATCERLARYVAPPATSEGWTGQKCPHCEGTGETMGRDQEVMPFVRGHW